MYFHYEVTPRAPRWTRDAELISKPDAPDERDFPVDEHELPMIAEEVLQPLTQLHGVVHPKLDASVGQPTTVRL
jgi:hypothetical protein